MKPKHWFVFITLGAIWSASFLWIKIAVQELGPLTLVAFRVLFGLLTGVIITIILRVPWPRERRAWLALGLLGITNIVIPFVLITWGEKTIDSAVASILNATVPLFTIVIAHFFLRDDKMTVARVAGLLVGFAGVTVLLSQDLDPQAHNSLLGQAAVIVASLSYAISTVFARKNTVGIPDQIRGALPLVSATAVMWILAPTLEAPLKIPTLPLTWVALIWLGTFGSGLAFIMMYYLIHEIGPTRATLVTYIFPLGGVILGVIFLHEHLTWQLAVGALLIIASIAVVNWKPRQAVAAQQ